MMRIWDIHCHLPSSRVRGASLTEQMGHLLEISERVGIEKICVFLRTGRQRGPNDDREIMRALNRYHGRVFGFVWCSLPKTQESIDKLNRWVGDGPMVGLKLGGGSGICSNPEYDPVFQRAIDLKAVIYQHTWIKLGGSPLRPGGGNLPRESTPQDVAQLAQRFPDYPIICGHTGGDWERGIRTVREYKNVSVELGGGYPTAGMVEMAVGQLGADRVVYGSDVTGRSFSSQLGKVHGAEIDQQDKQTIFYDNLHRMMQPILEKKGINVQ